MLNSENKPEFNLKHNNNVQYVIQSKKNNFFISTKEYENLVFSWKKSKVTVNTVYMDYKCSKLFRGIKVIKCLF